MPGLVERKFFAVRQADRRQQPPALIGYPAGYLDAFVLQLSESGLDVVTHQVQLVTAVPVGRMHGQLGRGQGEDEPASARVDRRQTQHVREERTHLLGCRREHDRMNASDHAVILARRLGS